MFFLSMQLQDIARNQDKNVSLFIYHILHIFYYIISFYAVILKFYTGFPTRLVEHFNNVIYLFYFCLFFVIDMLQLRGSFKLIDTTNM